MRRNVLVGCVAMLLISVMACGGGEEAEIAALEEASEAKFAELGQAREALREKRQQVAAKSAQLAEAAEEEVAGLESEIAGLRSEVDASAEKFANDLITFINEAGIAQDEVLSGRPAEAMRMKSDEDIIVAKEYIEVGGDYKRAIEIYETALQYDPTYERLNELKAEAEALRFMTKERFAAVKKGMTPAEVRAVIGTANPYNVQTYPERKVEAWFYPKGTDGSAAGVYFEEKKGVQKVYMADFNAVKATSAS